MLKKTNIISYLVIVSRVACGSPKVWRWDHCGQRLVQNHRLFVRIIYGWSLSEIIRIYGWSLPVIICYGWSIVSSDNPQLWMIICNCVDHGNREQLMIILDLLNNHSRMILFGFLAWSASIQILSHISHFKFAWVFLSYRMHKFLIIDASNLLQSPFYFLCVLLVFSPFSRICLGILHSAFFGIC